MPGSHGATLRAAVSLTSEVMSLLVPETPLSSRCGFVRGRKRIKPHPVSELRKQTNFVTPSSDEEEEDTCADADCSCANNSNNERKPLKPYTLRKKT
ncbi:uncharacterized protein LOC111595712 [Drosophila hydei]|uniref:Uncharacterized protein LOC111595712 n=1 Tax=Drosophila hydei TaxID=7224 RepID=A0A6J1LKW5_DROHY|nr:uncharacterized protein LOC111595712 [Drosophila hydei]